MRSMVTFTRTQITCVAIMLVVSCEVALSESSGSSTSHPSMVTFEQLFGDVSAIPPKQRDYTTILAKIRDLCNQYPNTEAAVLSITAVQKWRDAGYISEADASIVREYEQKFNPGKQELDDAFAAYRDARANRNADKMGEIATRLEKIADRYPGTLTRYIAMSNVSSAYMRAGEPKKAIDAVHTFIAEYPPQRTAYAGSSTMEHANIFREAELIAQTVSVDAALAKYSEIADSYSDRKGYVIPALYDGGTLALRKDKPEKAIQLFSRLIASYPEETNETVVLAQFRIGEALLQQKQPEAALAIFRELSRKYRDSRFGKEANEWIAFAESIQARMKSDPTYQAYTQPSLDEDRFRALFGARSGTDVVNKTIEERLSNIDKLHAENEADIGKGREAASEPIDSDTGNSSHAHRPLLSPGKEVKIASQWHYVAMGMGAVLVMAVIGGLALAQRRRKRSRSVDHE